MTLIPTHSLLVMDLNCWGCEGPLYASPLVLSLQTVVNNDSYKTYLGLVNPHYIHPIVIVLTYHLLLVLLRIAALLRSLPKSSFGPRAVHIQGRLLPFLLFRLLFLAPIFSDVVSGKSHTEVPFTYACKVPQRRRLPRWNVHIVSTSLQVYHA